MVLVTRRRRRSTTHQQEFDFIDVVIGPDGTPWTPWTSMVDGCTRNECSRLGYAVMGHLVGGPSLGSSY